MCDNEKESCNATIIFNKESEKEICFNLKIGTIYIVNLKKKKKSGSKRTMIQVDK